MLKLFSVLLYCNWEMQNVLLELSPSISGVQSNPYSIRYTSGCKRTFSNRKYVKNRLGSQLSEEHIDSLLLVCQVQYSSTSVERHGY